jgi:hypothetical protein
VPGSGGTACSTLGSPPPRPRRQSQRRPGISPSGSSRRPLQAVSGPAL